MSDAIAILKDDHRRVEQLFQQFDQSGDFDVAMQVCLELTVHAMVEEELLYGLYSAKVDSKGAMDARAEHQEAKDLILQIESMEPGSEELVTTMTKLKTSVLHHVDEEENEMFPKLLETLPETAALLGNDIATRRVAVQEQVLADRQVGMAPSTSSQKPTASPEPGW